MKIAVLGDRDAEDSYILNEFAKIDKGSDYVILTTGEEGVARIIQRYSKVKKLDLIRFVPVSVLDKSVPHDPRHLMARDREIIQNCDVLVFFDGNRSDYPCSYALRKNKIVIRIPKDDKSYL